MIRHQLVTHLSLGIALRYVLDALRKPADSKVCVVLKSEFLSSFHSISGLTLLSHVTDVFVWKFGIGTVSGSSY